MERADHVLAERMVDRGLAADRRVDLREQRRGHLHARDAAQVDRRREAGHVADHAAAERDDRRRAIGPELEETRQEVAQRLQALVLLAVGDQHDVGRDAGLVERRAQRRQVVRGNDRVGDDDRPARVARQHVAHPGERPAADHDRVAARAERDVEPPHRAPSCAGRGSDSHARAKRSTSSRSDAMTWSATAR